MVDEALIDRVIEQIKIDVEAGDFTAIAEMLLSVPEEDLKGFLPELERPI